MTIEFAYTNYQRSLAVPYLRITLKDNKVSILWAKNEVILNFVTSNDILTPIFESRRVWFDGILHLIKFSCPILEIEVKMRIFKIFCTSVVSVGQQVYPQYKHKFGFLTKKANTTCGNGAQGMEQHQNYLQKLLELAIWG